MIDLHLHLDGSLAPALVRELARTQGLPLPAGSLEEALSAPADCQSLNDYLRCFDLPVAVLQTRQALSLIHISRTWRCSRSTLPPAGL